MTPFEDHAHVLRRTSFGPWPEQVAALQAEVSSTTELIDRQFESVVPFEPQQVHAVADGDGHRLEGEGPLEIDGADPSLYPDPDAAKNWWVTRMVDPRAALHEKMMWTWHGIFTTSTRKVDRLNPLYQQAQVLHRHALGNFRDLVLEMQLTAGMLLYLDGNNSSYLGPPNENHARELMELFTLGPGNYTQHDVVEASKAMSGWSVDIDVSGPVPDNKVHFVEAFGPPKGVTVIGRSGIKGVPDLVDALLAHEACGPFVVGRLWDTLIGSPRDAQLVARWGRSFRSGGYEIRPLLEQMLHSDAFADSVRSRPRSGIEWYLALLGAVDLIGRRPVSDDLRHLAQVPWEPPNVAGWPTGNAWLSSASANARLRLLSELPWSQVEVADEPVVDACLERCSVYDASAGTRTVLERLAASIPDVDPHGRAVAVMQATLMSPEFLQA